MKEPQVVLVDINDNELGFMGKMEAHRKALLHRAISVFIFNSNGEWLIQQRAADKYHSGGLWTNTCCSHPLPGESNIDAANRCLIEEIGVDCILSEIFSFIYNEELDNELTEHELDHVFYGYSDQLPLINSNEVMNYRYINYSDLKNEILRNPDQYTVWFKKVFEQVNHRIEKINNFIKSQG